MTLNRLLITSVVVENRPVRDVAAQYGVSQSWLFELLARYRAEGEAAFESRSRRPRSVPTTTPTETVDLILELREKLTTTRLDAGPDTIRWHLKHHHSIVVSRATISRYLTKAGLVVPDPKKKPKSSYTRFAAEMPNETWQSDFTHYRLTRPDGRTGADTEILTWLDDCPLRPLGHRPPPVTGPIVLATFRETLTEHQIPASTLDNGMVFTTRLSQGKKGAGTRNGLETELRRLNVVQKNGRPNHPTTQGKVERFQQTMKKWLRAQPEQPSTIDDLQALLDAFVEEYNDRSLELLDRLQLPAPYAARIASLRRIMVDLDFEIDLFENLVRGRLRTDPGYAAVQQIPGIGPILGAVFVAEVGDVTRFASAPQLVCWAGLTPKHHESDTHVHRGRITKQGSRLVRWAAVQSVKRVGPHTRVGALRDRVADRRGKNISAVAAVAARQQVGYVFYALRDGHVRALQHPVAHQHRESA